MARRPNAWLEAMSAVDRIDLKILEILSLPRVPRHARALLEEIREEIRTVLRLNGRAPR